MVRIILAILVSYLIGSIPTAYLSGRILKGIDIRKFGSGNVGATNALRVLGRGPAIMVLVLDMLKGFIVVSFLGDFFVKMIPDVSSQMLRIILGLSSISGHNWTIFLNFKGGKGIATTFGVLIGLATRIAGLKVVLALAILTWLLVFMLSKIVSLSSIITGMALPIYIILFKQSYILISSSIIITIFILLRHRANLKRLWEGKEPRLTFRKS